MTRVIVAREGASPFPGTFIERNCFKMPEGKEEMWLVFPGDNHNPIGKARDFQRDETTGAISFDFEMHPDYKDFPLKEEHLAFFANELIESRIGDVRHVHEATIRQITYLPHSGNPAVKRRDPEEIERTKHAISAAIRRQGLAVTDEAVDLMAHKLTVELIAVSAWPISSQDLQAP